MMRITMNTFNAFLDVYIRLDELGISLEQNGNVIKIPNIYGCNEFISAIDWMLKFRLSQPDHISLWEAKMSTRARGAARHLGCWSLGDVLRAPMEDFSNLPGVGKVTIAEIKALKRKYQDERGMNA